MLMLIRNVHWVVRIVLAMIYIYHGFDKFPTSQFAEHFGLSISVAFLVAIGEIFIGICLFFGGLGLSWITRLGGLCMVIIMVGAVVMVRWGQPWPAMEFEVLLAALGLNYLFRGNK